MSFGILAEYGRLGHVGRFTDPAGHAPTRGSVVVVAGPRGLELARVLGSATAIARSLDPAAGGELVRPATPVDLAHAATQTRITSPLLQAATESAATLSLSVLDCEILFSGVAILHVLPWAACECDPWAAALAERFGCPVRVMDVSPPPVPVAAHSGCGSCGETGGKCSSGGCGPGGCSRTAVKSADELTRYFADLRTQMETANRVSLG